MKILEQNREMLTEKDEGVSLPFGKIIPVSEISFKDEQGEKKYYLVEVVKNEPSGFFKYLDSETDQRKINMSILKKDPFSQRALKVLFCSGQKISADQNIRYAYLLAAYAFSKFDGEKGHNSFGSFLRKSDVKSDGKLRDNDVPAICKYEDLSTVARKIKRLIDFCFSKNPQECLDYSEFLYTLLSWKKDKTREQILTEYYC